MTKQSSQQGNVLFYILIAIFLAGVLTVTLTQGPEKSAQTAQLDELGISIKSDISIIESAISDCVIMYSKGGPDIDNDGTIDSSENPNNPFPLASDLSTSYDPIDTIRCPGAPTNEQLILNTKEGRGLRILSDTATYTVKYKNDGTEGVFIEATRNNPDPLWTEMLSRLNDTFPACKSAVDGDTFYYWIKRLGTSVLGPEAGCP